MGCSASAIASPQRSAAPANHVVQPASMSGLPSRLPPQLQLYSLANAALSTHSHSSTAVRPRQGGDGGSRSSSPYLSRHASLSYCTPAVLWDDGVHPSTPGPMLDDMLPSGSIVESILLHRRTSKSSMTSASIKSPLEDFAATAELKPSAMMDELRCVHPLNSIDCDVSAGPLELPTIAATTTRTTDGGTFTVPSSVRCKASKQQQQQHSSSSTTSTSVEEDFMLPTPSQLPMVLPVASFYLSNHKPQQQQTSQLHRQSSFGNYSLPTAFAFPTSSAKASANGFAPAHRRSFAFVPKAEDAVSAGSPSAHSSANGAISTRRRLPSTASVHDIEEAPQCYQSIPIPPSIPESPCVGKKPQLRLALTVVPFKSPAEAAFRNSPTSCESSFGRAAGGRHNAPPPIPRFRLVSAPGASSRSVGASSLGDTSARSLMLESSGGTQLLPVYRSRFNSLSRRSGFESSGLQHEQDGESDVWAMNEDDNEDGAAGFMVHIPNHKIDHSARSIHDAADLPLYFTEDE
jgi:hypothetical protein